ncbi:hypothetical protein NEOLEDRAFT_1140576 [Neolentinus lepideus HHB14362 ss-1]|uniref:Uncharacterized protein n=1 Tax=Neolentinus lepideus HHB14362 ss-1 TaxID=1314782 RepID=A0A165P6N3_9AGAM|nr:hypothetical protein NEOLEDRAFT_1140576 [Neolentinus lepideus HHB14362 ss-1]
MEPAAESVENKNKLSKNMSKGTTKTIVQSLRPSQPTLSAEPESGSPRQSRTPPEAKRYAYCFDSSGTLLPYRSGLHLRNNEETSPTRAASTPKPQDASGGDENKTPSSSAGGSSTEWEQDMRFSLDKIQRQIKELDDRALARRMSDDMCSTPRSNQHSSKSKTRSEQILPSPLRSPIESTTDTPGQTRSGESAHSLSTAAGRSSSREDLSDLIAQFPRPPSLLSIPRYSTLSLGPVLGLQDLPRDRGSIASGYQISQGGIPTPPLTPLIASTVNFDSKERKSLDFMELGLFPTVRGEDLIGGARTYKRRPLGENAPRVRESLRSGRMVTEGKENTTARGT